jgi:hypothetical protein
VSVTESSEIPSGSRGSEKKNTYNDQVCSRLKLKDVRIAHKLEWKRLSARGALDTLKRKVITAQAKALVACKLDCAPGRSRRFMETGHYYASLRTSTSFNCAPRLSSGVVRAAGRGKATGAHRWLGAVVMVQDLVVRGHAATLHALRHVTPLHRQYERRVRVVCQAAAEHDAAVL